jgi:protein gp37
MAEHSRIEWTDASWNPVTGCTKVSPGCAHCYAELFAERWRGLPGHPYERGFDLTLHPDRLPLPLRWRQPKRIFVNSMSDLFHPDVPREFIVAVFDVMVRASWHTFQVLTKRAERLADLAPTLPWPTNVWMGVSIENRRFVYRADLLRTVPAAVRFISAEPLLGPLTGLDLRGIDWLIAGGESGPKARPMHPEWVLDLRDRCRDSGVCFFFKQWGAFRPSLPDEKPTVAIDEMGRIVNDRGRATAPVGRVAYLTRVGKGRAGRLLDGRIWDGSPQARSVCEVPGLHPAAARMAHQTK